MHKTILLTFQRIVIEIWLIMNKEFGNWSYVFHIVDLKYFWNCFIRIYPKFRKNLKKKRDDFKIHKLGNKAISKVRSAVSEN